MPGSGKSFWSKQLAEYFSIQYFDLDDIIIAQSGMTIESIFEIKGEDYFRQLELECLNELLHSNKGLFVLATGGGTPCFNENHDILNNNTDSIFLNVSIQSLIDNLHSSSEERPLLKSGIDLQTQLMKLWETRKSFYHKAQKNIESPISMEKLDALILS